MKKIISFLFFIPLFLNAQNMSQNGFRSLFSDYKAVNLGDAITIIVVESSEASNAAQKSTGQESGIGFGLSGGLDATATAKS